MKSQFFPNRVFWQLNLVTRLSHEFKLQENDLASLRLLSCSATAGVTLQLLACLARVHHSGGLQQRVLVSLHNLEQFFTLSHKLPLHDSHLNTGLLIAKIQANLARSKANKMVDKIQPYRSHQIPSIKFKTRAIVKVLILFTVISFPIQFHQQMKHQINNLSTHFLLFSF